MGPKEARAPTWSGWLGSWFATATTSTVRTDYVRYDVGPLPTVFTPGPGCNQCSLPPKEYTTVSTNGRLETVALPYRDFDVLSSIYIWPGDISGQSPRETTSWHTTSVCTAYEPVCQGTPLVNSCRPPSRTALPTTKAPGSRPTVAVGFHSPGFHCPLGWNTARTVQYTDPVSWTTSEFQPWFHVPLSMLRPDETAAFCCPALYTLDENMLCIGGDIYDTITGVTCDGGTASTVTGEIWKPQREKLELSEEAEYSSYWSSLESMNNKVATATDGLTYIPPYLSETYFASPIQPIATPVILVQRSGDVTRLEELLAEETMSPTALPTSDTGFEFVPGARSGLSTGALAGIVVAAILIPLLSAAAFGFWFVRRRKRRDEEHAGFVDEKSAGGSEAGGSGSTQSDPDAKYDKYEKAELDASLAALPPLELPEAGQADGSVEIGDSTDYYELSPVNNVRWDPDEMVDKQSVKDGDEKDR